MPYSSVEYLTYSGFEYRLGDTDYIYFLPICAYFSFCPWKGFVVYKLKILTVKFGDLFITFDEVYFMLVDLVLGTLHPFCDWGRQGRCHD